MTSALIDARRAVHAQSAALRGRAGAARREARAVVARADRTLARARTLYAASWDAQLARWCARQEPSHARRSGGSPPDAEASRWHDNGAARRWTRGTAVAAAAAPEPSVDRAAHRPPASCWAAARVFGERRIPLEADPVSASYVVREIDTRELRGAHGPRCLVFDSPYLVRRVWSFPVDWATLSDDALLALGGLAP